MIKTKMPGLYTTVLFNMTEMEEELRHVGVTVDPADYMVTIIRELGFPVFTPPWIDLVHLPGLPGIVKHYHVSEVFDLLTRCLKEAGYNGEELHVTTRVSMYCAVSFQKE